MGLGVVARAVLFDKDGNALDMGAAAPVFGQASVFTGSPFSLPVASFSGTKYLATDINDSTGFDCTKYGTVIAAFDNVFSGLGLIVEQTNDPTGSTGWHRCYGRPLGVNTIGSSGSYAAYPVIGARMRFRVTAMSSGQIDLRLVGLPYPVVSPRLLGQNLVGRIAQAASTNAAAIRSSALCTVYGYEVYNTGAAVAYLKLYDKASAPISTDVPKIVISVPPSGRAYMYIPDGVEFISGLAYQTVTGAADNDVTAVAANQLIGHVLYAFS